MRLATKLDEWQAAGLIDAPSAAAILAHEESRQRPVALFAVAGLGLLALALGLFSLIAANWDELSPAFKLTVHALLTAAAALATLHFARCQRVRAGEAALFLLAALTLAGIALQSQVYQLTGELWQALVWWAVLVSPALLLLGRTRLVAYGYGLMLIVLATTYALDDPDALGRNLALALPAALVLASLVLPDERAIFRNGVFEIGFAAALGGASVAQLGWLDRMDGDDAWTVCTGLPLCALLVAASMLVLRRRRPRADAELISATLAGSLLAVLFAIGLPHGSGPATRFVGVLVFLALWGAVAAAATRAGWHRLFQVAVAALALRLFLVYFELFYSLAFTGVGLIVAGLLLIGARLGLDADRPAGGAVMRRWLVLAAVALPVLGTLGGIAAQETALSGATVWRIPITGYDPRDPLRGRFIAFSYVWDARGDPAQCRNQAACQLCLEEGGTRVLITAKGASCPAPIDLAASGLALTRFVDVEPGRVRARARLWVSETRAPLLERQLRSMQMVAVTRLTRDGRLIADRLEPAR